MRLVLPAVFTSLLLTHAAVHAADQTLLQLPAPVRTAIERAATGRDIAAIERDQREGRTVYRVRIAQEGIDKRMVIAADGTVLEVSDYRDVNQALANGKQAGKEAWDKTKEASGEAWDATRDAASRTWQATKETVAKATSAFKSDELTLNQVPPAPRATMEREAAGNRLSGIRAVTEEQVTRYHATITQPDGTTRRLVVRDDGTLVTGQ
jgi:NADH dehydrogenase/NADH:ubiquinone oxidoreductase subunit G